MWALNISGEIVNLVNGNTITLGQTSALWEIVLTLNVTGFDGKGRFCEYKDTKLLSTYKNEQYARDAFHNLAEQLCVVKI